MSTLEWRDKHIIPRHNAAGVGRFAFHVPPGAPRTVEFGGVPTVEVSATFPTPWFTTCARAEEWLANGA